MWHLTQKRADAKAEASDEKTWRKARLDAEQAIRDEIKTERAEQLRRQLDSDADWARVAEILKDINETQKLTATLAADSKHHSSELSRINNRVEDVSRQLNQFVMSHAKHS